MVDGIKIRRAEPDDYAAIHEIFSCPKVFANTLQLPYPLREDWRRRLSEPADGNYFIVAVIDNKVVGMIGIHSFLNKPRRCHAAAIGMAVHDDWQGKGIGAALMAAGLDLADNWLNLARLELEVYADNLGAIRLYERFGFEREGTMRKHAFRDGQFVDSHMMARLRQGPGELAADKRG